MQYRVYERQSLRYIDGGYVRDFTVDDDYIVNNNSTISTVKKSKQSDTFQNIVPGNIIALIENSGAYHKGVITTVDNAKLTISYKSDKALFDDKMPNPFIKAFTDNNVSVAGTFGIGEVINILDLLFVKTSDKCKKLPIEFIAHGDVLDEEGNGCMLWKWKDNSIKIVDWLISLFEEYNVSLSWTIDFDIGENDLSKRIPKYICTLSAITDSGGIIKDNVAMQTIKYSENGLPEATVCVLIDSNTKEILEPIYYLYEKNGIYSVGESPDLLDAERVLPVKTAIVSYNSNQSGEDVSPKSVAEENLIPSKYNQSIEIQILSGSKMFDFENAKFGDLYKIINEHGTIDSVYTGRKSTSVNKYITLYFGLNRQNYTDIMQIQMRKSRYTIEYNLR